MWQQYFSVTTLAEAQDLLSQYREQARVVAGGTDLLIELERGIRKGIEVVIDITRVPGIADIRLDANDWIHLGALVTHNQCAASALIQQRALPLAQACWEVGAPQIRNRGTIAGNLITASPANDTITPMMALDAVVTLASSERGERQVPLREFYKGVRKNVMQADEMLVDISFPALRADERGMFIKLALRRAQAISVVDTAVIVALSGDTVSSARIAMGAVAPTIVRAPHAEAYLVGKTLTPEVMNAAGVEAQKSASPISDVRAPADYRLEMVKVTVMRALRAIAAGAERGALPHEPIVLKTADTGEPLTLMLTHGADSVIETHINGKAYSLRGAAEKTLLRALREDALLTGTKEGCAEGECGACTVFLDGAAVMSCMVPAPRAHGAEIVTVEGLTQDDALHPIQQAFVENGAVQCGYCTPGFVMAGAKLMEERPGANQHEIEQAITGNLCRCTGYYKILAAFLQAAQTQKTEVAS